MPSAKTFRRASAVVAALVALPAFAQDLLPNGDFSDASQLAGWSAALSGTILWSSQDAAGNAASGSLQGESAGTGNPVLGVSSCMAVTGGQTFRYGGSASGGVGFASAGFVCTAFDANDCSGTGASLDYVDLHHADAAPWYAASVDGVLPPHAQSVHCSTSNNAMGASTVYFDDLFFESPGPGRLVNGDFRDVDQIDGWSCSSIFGSVHWTADDAAATPPSGSIELSAAAFGDVSWFQGLEVCDSTCFDVRPGAAFAYGGQSRLETFSGGAGSSFAMHLACGVYAEAGCSGAPTWLPAPVMPMESGWTAPATQQGYLPGNAASVSCQLLVVADGENAAGAGRFDNLFFTTDVIYANGYE